MWIASGSVRRPIPEATAQATFPHTGAAQDRYRWLVQKSRRRSFRERRRPALRGREYLSGRRHDLQKLCGVYELSELSDLAVAHIPDVHDREVQLLAGAFPVPV